VEGDYTNDAGICLFQARLNPSFISKCLIAMKVNH